eukprot:CAMPEP_0119036774 /NCGR_PEP_ID=MMETSP1177-20130426/4725_1 /TAXON_ID=2985 /ORGANISM="Ochromonas sp, Strain CCMP1899" /LENGTH=49 /DNA_ID=CAMNT_0006997119 /DNA_START=79 /DNA_END=228 /DNA_ORIENTATION=+
MSSFVKRVLCSTLEIVSDLISSFKADDIDDDEEEDDDADEDDDEDEDDG